MLVLAIDIDAGIRVDAGEAQLLDQDILQLQLPSTSALLQSVGVFHLIGATYVHGIMTGKFFREGSERREDTITLI